MIDDFKYKKRDFSRIELKFTSSLGKVLTVWEIESLLERFASLYYKTDIIHTLCNLSISGIEINKLVISGKDFNYLDFPLRSDFELNPDIGFIYKSDLTTSLKVDKHHTQLAFIFNYFRFTNRLLDTFYEPTIFIRELLEIIKVVEKTGLEKGLDAIMFKAVARFNKKKVNDFEQILQARKSSLLAEWSIFLKRMDLSLNIQEKANIDIFFRKLSHLSKPIVCFSEPTKGRYSMIGFDHFKNVTQPQFFDVRRISHESPTEFVLQLSPQLIYAFFTALGIFISGVVRLGHDYYKGRRDKKEYESITEKEKSQELIEKHRNSVKSLVNEYSLLGSNYKNVILENIEKVNDGNMKAAMLGTLEEIEQDYLYLVSDFSIDLISANPV